MEQALVHFSRVLRAAGVRVSTGEAVDALRAAAAVELQDRDTVKIALGVTLVKDSRDWPLYSDLYDRFFRLEPPVDASVAHDHAHGHDNLRDELVAERVTLSREPAAAPQIGHDHAKPADIRDYFDERDLASSYNLHQDASKIDMTSLTEHIVLAEDQRRRSSPDAQRVQLETDRLHGAESVGELSATSGTRVDVDLSIAGQALAVDSARDLDPDAADEALRRRVDGMLADLPELLRDHLARLAAQNRSLEQPTADTSPAYLERVSERDRIRMEEGTRRLARQLHGALTSRTYPARRGRVSVGKTMRRNLRHDGVPFRPVTVARKEDRPRLVVLADVSLSVRNSARFTLHLVHGLQRLFPRVRTFVFVDDLVEVTELFTEHPLEAALGLIFGGGELLDVDGNSDYGSAFGEFVDTHLAAVTHRTSVVVLGDGRSNGADPGYEAFESIARRARRVVWLTPEPRYSWTLGRCDLPGYAEMCQAVHVVRDANGLDAATLDMTAALSRPA
ncbi:MAG: VWA domain-containing protein [Frankiaceae bacterium]